MNLIMEENLVGFVLALHAKRWYDSQISVDDQTGIWMRPESSGRCTQGSPSREIPENSFKMLENSKIL